MFDDGKNSIALLCVGANGKFVDELYGGIDIYEVVIGKFFTVQLME